jgi:hypothetical protein
VSAFLAPPGDAGGTGGAGGAGAMDTSTEASPSKFREAVDNALAARDAAKAPGT